MAIARYSGVRKTCQVTAAQVVEQAWKNRLQLWRNAIDVEYLSELYDVRLVQAFVVQYLSLYIF